MKHEPINVFAELFNEEGLLKSPKDLSRKVSAHIASFEIVRITTRQSGEVHVTEEVVQVKLRNGQHVSARRRRGLQPGRKGSQMILSGGRL
jgi:hypothetical protein